MGANLSEINILTARFRGALVFLGKYQTVYDVGAIGFVPFYVSSVVLIVFDFDFDFDFPFL